MELVIKKIKQYIRNLIVSFSYGLKNTESEIFGQKTGISEASHIQQKVSQNELAEALLRGEVTEEVEMLRDRTYLVSNESKKYKVVTDTVGTTKAFKKMAKKTPPKSYNEDGYEISLIMDNKVIPSGVLQGLNSVGGYGIEVNYPLKFEYEYTPKFKLDEYVSKLVIRESQDGSSMLMDLYVPKYTDSFERLKKIFDAEINKIKNQNKKPNNIQFKTVKFISENAFGSEDLIPYEYTFKKILNIEEFDGKHVLIYEVEKTKEEEKITEKYKNKKLRSAYENKEPRKGRVLNLGKIEVEKHKCEVCGEEIKNEYDYRILKETTGKALCENCLKNTI